MSILQEYAIIRKQIDEKKYQAINKYLSLHPDLFLSDIYYKKSEWDAFETWYNQTEA